MADIEPQRRKSAFNEHGLEKSIEHLLEEISSLYKADKIPWVVGYSGGKDSSATLQLVWMALTRLPTEELHKQVYVISTDTLVENPIVAAWVNKSLETMGDEAKEAGIPLTAHRLTPDPTNTFWVNLIGRGYPAPRPRFRWCTERLKINPATKFINEVVQTNGEAIVVLGTRKAESSSRSHVMSKLEAQQVRAKLSPNTDLPNSYVYSPIAEWSNDDVWMFLMQKKNPWGYNNKDLLTLYQGASADGECPLVIDSSTPSCGDSRFGCWVCTLVEQDRSMQAMIQNDADKEWMQPLLDLRNELDVKDDRPLRDFRRMNGHVQLFKDRLVPGPYTQEAREDWLRKLLRAQRHVRENGPDEMRDLSLITIDELQEIRRIWVTEKHEIEDSLPRIYEEATGDEFPAGSIDDGVMFDADDVALLRELCGDDQHFSLTRQLLSIEKKHRVMARRSRVFQELERAITRGFYDDAEDAEMRARAIQAAKDPRAAAIESTLSSGKPEGDLRDEAL
jgi:DNA sulfur modification protein DndC